MGGQHTENLFRRFKDKLVLIKTVSGGIYEGRITDVTNDYVCLLEKKGDETSQVYVFLHSVESMMLVEVPVVS